MIIMKYIAFAVALIVAVVVYFLFFKQESYELDSLMELDPRADRNVGSVVNYLSQLKNAKTVEEKEELTENWSHFIDPTQFTDEQKMALKKLEDKLSK